ncbi:MAG TPA: NAD(P)-dependent oxidoreductase [Verrucomicrobiae bacterium]|nr:NAD(P)-dependent oxidoreductase [Verrucomicrobiae bacterium]
MKIGVCGLGIIGSVWAGNLRQDGHDVRGWNRSPKQFPWYVPRASDAANDAEIIFIVVADPPAVQNVLNQILPGLHAGQVVIQSSTISPKATLASARQVQQTGAAFLEAPFTGSKPAAERRQTVFYIGGDKRLLEQVRPVLERLATSALYIGPLGSASALKLAMNINIALVAQGLCESLAFARAAGIPDDAYFAALKPNVSHSGLATLKEPKLRAREFSPQFSLKHMAKDLRLALDAAADLPLSQTRQVMQTYEAGLKRGWGDQDFSVLAELLEQKP